MTPQSTFAFNKTPSVLSRLITTLLVFSAVAYGVLFAYSLNTPETIEHQTHDFIKTRIARITHQKIASLGTKHAKNPLIKLSKRIWKKKSEKLARYQRALKEHLDEKLAIVMGKMRNLDCSCRKKYAHFYHGVLLGAIADLKEKKDRLEAFMSYQYMHIIQKIIHDIRIFLGSSLLVILMLLALRFLKPQDRRPLDILAATMLVSTLIASYLYLFQQNWFMTIIFSDYLGYTYLLYLGIVFLLLLDIIFNRSRVIHVLIEILGQGIGSALGPAC
jgi:hypothetical protein